jgi:hypothetical protein
MIDRLGSFLQHNLVVCLAVVLIPLKIIVLRLCGDSEAMAAAFLAIPEDIGYVCLGLILGDVATSEKSFRRHFGDSANASIDIVLVVVINVSVAVITHVLAKWGNDHFKSFRAAGLAGGSGSRAGQKQLEMPHAATDDDLRMIQIRHLSVFSTIYLTEIALTIYWLSWIAKVVANG